MMAPKGFAGPLTRSRLHEEIVTVIQKQIMSGRIAAGDKLPTERELAENFQVNRATVREALRKLENLDLVEIRHGDGLYVKIIWKAAISTFSRPLLIWMAAGT